MIKGDKMNGRREIIIQEIKYWQKNRLLPDTYCLFLQRLYEEDAENPKERLSFLKPLSFVFALLAMIALTFLVIYFTQFSSVMQIVFVNSMLLFLIAGAVYTARKKLPMVTLYVSCAAILLFFSFLSLAGRWFPENQGALVFAILGTCLIWIVFGWKLRYYYLVVAGGMGIILTGIINFT